MARRNSSREASPCRQLQNCVVGRMATPDHVPRVALTPETLMLKGIAAHGSRFSACDDNPCRKNSHHGFFNSKKRSSAATGKVTISLFTLVSTEFVTCDQTAGGARFVVE